MPDTHTQAIPTTRAAELFGTGALTGPTHRLRMVTNIIAARLEARPYQRLPRCERTDLRHATLLLAEIADRIDAQIEALRPRTERERVTWWGRLVRRRGLRFGEGG